MKRDTSPNERGIEDKAKRLAEKLRREKLSAALAEAISKAAKPLRAGGLSNAALLTVLEGDAGIDTIIQRIRDLNAKVAK